MKKVEGEDGQKYHGSVTNICKDTDQRPSQRQSLVLTEINLRSDDAPIPPVSQLDSAVNASELEVIVRFVSADEAVVVHT